MRYQRADEILVALEAMGTPSLPGFGGTAPPVAESWFARLPHALRLGLIIGAVVLATLLLLAVFRQ